jgi:outer membrane protein, heavy metal efflux system
MKVDAKFPSRNIFFAALFVIETMWAPVSFAAVIPQQEQLPPITLNDDWKPTVNPERTMSLRASFDQAYENNKEVISSKYNLPVAKAGIQISKAILNPRFNFLYGFGPEFKLILAGEPQQFGWQEEFQTAGKRTKLINVARANYVLADLQLKALMFDVHNRTRRAYAELAAAEAYADLIESQRRVALELQKTAQYRFDAGKAARAEVLQAELGVLQFDTQRNQAQGRLQQATAALSLLVGEVPKHIEVIDVDDNGIFKLSADKTDLVPQPDRSLPPLKDLLSVAQSERPDLKVAVQQAFSDRRSLTAAKSLRIPDLFIDCGYQFTTFSPVQPYNLIKSIVPNSPGCYLNVSFELPFFYQHQGETTQAKATWLQDYAQIDQLKWQINSDTITAYESVAVSRANIAQFQRDLIPQAAEVARLARRRYEVGKTDLATAILAKQQYQQILSSYFDSVVAYQNAWADLEKSVGVPLKL